MSGPGESQERIGNAGRDPEKTIASGTRTLVIGPYLTRRAAAQKEANKFLLLARAKSSKPAAVPEEKQPANDANPRE